jgi:hypothetical protein
MSEVINFNWFFRKKLDYLSKYKVTRFFLEFTNYQSHPCSQIVPLQKTASQKMSAEGICQYCRNLARLLSGVIIAILGGSSRNHCSYNNDKFSSDDEFWKQDSFFEQRTTNNEYEWTNPNDEIIVKGVNWKGQEWYNYLPSQWKNCISGVIEAALGLTYSFVKKPVYTASLSFALEDEKSGGGLGRLLGLASSFWDRRWRGGSVFTGSNLTRCLNPGVWWNKLC